MIDQTYMGASRGDQDDDPDEFDRAAVTAPVNATGTRECRFMLVHWIMSMTHEERRTWEASLRVGRRTWRFRQRGAR